MVGGLAKVYHHVHPLVELITCSGEGVLSTGHKHCSMKTFANEPNQQKI